jgi:outer membrane receptor protein involved in Fe transport
MSGKVPYLSNLFFFLSGTFLNENSYLPWGFRLERQVLGKLTYTPISGIKLNLIYENQDESTQNYSHLYKYFPYYNAQGQGEQSIHRIVMNRFGFSMTQTLNPATFYSLHLNYLSQNQRREIEARTVVFDSQTGAFLSSDYLQRAFVFGRESDFWYGDDRDWFRNHSRTFSTHSQITSQMNPNHQVKFGFDMRQHQICKHRIQRPWAASFYHRIEFYDRKPIEGAAFIQDKMEFDFMVLNLGLRLDYVHNNDLFWENPEKIQYIDENNQFQFVPQIKVPRRVQISPRIGLAHPVTDKLVFHFAYGHFFQNPGYSILFLNDAYLPNLKESDPILGNPGLKPQTTIAFEVGAKYQLASTMALEVTGYFRDMRNLVTTQYYARAPYDYTIFVNQDYGRIKGLDLTLTKRAGRFFSGILNYTYMIARGSGNDPFTGYYYREEDAYLRPKREIFLNFDRTHDLSVNLDFRLPPDFGPEFIRTKPLGGIGLNLLFSFASGLPYTPLDYTEASFNVEPYSARMGNSKSLDLRMDKRMKLSGMEHVFYLKIENLFDWKNPRIVWEATGDPWNGGAEDYNTQDRQADPTQVGPPLQIRIGYYVNL